MTRTDLGVLLRLEIRLRQTGAVWLADPLARTENEIRARLHSGELGILPAWPPGTGVDCSLTTSTGDYFADAVVAECHGGIVRLKINEALRTDRRRGPRANGGFAVSCSSGQETRAGLCRDIGEGGMCLCVAEPLAVGTPLSLEFALGGEGDPVRAAGLVASLNPSGQEGGWLVGVEFTALGATERDAVLRYCQAGTGV